jgi:hypothetical protein
MCSDGLYECRAAINSSDCEEYYSNGSLTNRESRRVNANIPANIFASFSYLTIRRNNLFGYNGKSIPSTEYGYGGYSFGLGLYLYADRL